MDLRLRTRPTAGQAETVIVEVAGELDLHAASGLRAELARATAAQSPRVAVDLSGVPFIDSTGVGVLVGALKRAREAGGRMAFCGAQPRVTRVFEITGLLDVLPLFATRDQALFELTSVPDSLVQTGEPESQPLILESSNE